jgi:hypothetical protein
VESPPQKGESRLKDLNHKDSRKRKRKAMLIGKAFLNVGDIEALL